MAPIRLILTVTRGHQQAVTAHEIVEDAGRAVVPGGDPFGCVSAEHDHNFRFRTEMRARLAGYVDVKSAVRDRSREVRMFAHERFEHATPVPERSTVEILVRQRARQNPDHFIDFPQRHARNIDMRDGWRIPCSGKQRHAPRIPSVAMKELECHLTFVIHRLVF